MGETANENMTEKNAATPEKKEKKAKKGTDAGEMNLTPHETIAREKKTSRWTMEICRKAASRFESREAWAKGAPSSFKAAVSRGWEAECMKALRAATPVTTSAPKRGKAPVRAA